MTRRFGTIPGRRYRSEFLQATAMADHLTEAAHAGFLEETLAHAKLMHDNLRIANDLEQVWYAGYRLEWSRRHCRYGVFAYESNGRTWKQGLAA